MPADLHIHTLGWVSEEELRIFRNEVPHTMEEWLDAYDSIYCGCPSVWVGQVSWLKAIVTGDDQGFIPGPVQAVWGIFGKNFVEITDEVISLVSAAMDNPNSTSYALNEKSKVVSFLRRNIGERAFIISW